MKFQVSLMDPAVGSSLLFLIIGKEESKFLKWRELWCCCTPPILRLSPPLTLVNVRLFKYLRNVFLIFIFLTDKFFL